MRRCRFCQLTRLTMTEFGMLICGGPAAYISPPRWLLDGRCPMFRSAGLSPEAAVDAEVT